MTNIAQLSAGVALLLWLVAAGIAEAAKRSGARLLQQQESADPASKMAETDSPLRDW